MKKHFMRGQRLWQSLVLVSLFLFTGCDKTQDAEPGITSAAHADGQKGATKTYYGSETQIGDGTAQVWVQTVQGKPVTLAIEITDDVLMSITGEEMFELPLPMPGQAHATGYKTVMIGWNPMGHEPEGVYTVPHFDFHFYMQTLGQIMQVEGGLEEEAWSLAGTVFPDFYTFGPVPVAVPHMGVHWSDVRSPEFSPAGFSRTFIYGSHNNRVTFLEPMITLEYLLSLEPGESETIAVPALLSYQDPGYYAMSYTITHTTYGTYIIALTDLVFRNPNM